MRRTVHYKNFYISYSKFVYMTIFLIVENKQKIDWKKVRILHLKKPVFVIKYSTFFFWKLKYIGHSVILALFWAFLRYFWSNIFISCFGRTLNDVLI